MGEFENLPGAIPGLALDLPRVMVSRPLWARLLFWLMLGEDWASKVENLEAERIELRGALTAITAQCFMCLDLGVVTLGEIRGIQRDALAALEDRE